MGVVVSVLFICVAVVLFAMVLLWEVDSGSRRRVLQPAGLFVG